MNRISDESGAGSQTKVRSTRSVKVAARSTRRKRHTASGPSGPLGVGTPRDYRASTSRLAGLKNYSKGINAAVLVYLSRYKPPPDPSPFACIAARIVPLERPKRLSFGFARPTRTEANMS